MEEADSALPEAEVPLEEATEAGAASAVEVEAAASAGAGVQGVDLSSLAEARVASHAAADQEGLSEVVEVAGATKRMRSHVDTPKVQSMRA